MYHDRQTKVERVASAWLSSLKNTLNLLWPSSLCYIHRDPWIFNVWSSVIVWGVVIPAPDMTIFRTWENVKLQELFLGGTATQLGVGEAAS